MAFVTGAALGGLRQTSLTGARCTSRPAVPARPSRTGVICTAAEPAAPAAETKDAETTLKRFLNELHRLGRLRLVTNNGAAVMESIATFDGLFYQAVRGSEYGNVIDHDANVDLHIRLAGVSGARWEVGAARGNSDASTYALRVLGLDKKTVKLSLFLQWEKDPADVEPERIEAWKDLKATFATDGDTAWFD